LDEKEGKIFVDELVFGHRAEPHGGEERHIAESITQIRLEIIVRIVFDTVFEEFAIVKVGKKGQQGFEFLYIETFDDKEGEILRAFADRAVLPVEKDGFTGVVHVVKDVWRLNIAMQESGIRLGEAQLYRCEGILNVFTDAQLVGRKNFVPFIDKDGPLFGNKVAAKGEEARIDGSFQLRECGFEGFVPELGVHIGHTVDNFQGCVNTICVEIQVGNAIAADKQVFEEESDSFIIVVFDQANVSWYGNILDVLGDSVVKIVFAFIQLELVGHL
jgi:hypothetical protein